MRRFLQYYIWLLRNVLFILAGADVQIIRKLPPEDRAPYRRTGRYQLLLICVCIFELATINFLSRVTIPLLYAGMFIILLVTIGIVMANRLVVNKLNEETSLTWFIVALLICTVMALPVYLRQMNKSRLTALPELNTVQALLVQDTIEIDKLHVWLKKSNEYYYGNKNSMYYDSTRYKVTRQDLWRYRNLYYDFTGQASLKIKETWLPDTVVIHSNVTSILHKLPFFEFDSYDNATIQEQIIPVLISYGDTISPSLRTIIAAFDGTGYNRLPPESQLGFLLSMPPTKPAIFIGLAVFLSAGIVFFVVYKNHRRNQHDFYHSILAEMKKQETEGLQAERQRIQEELRIQAEINNRQVAMAEHGRPLPYAAPNTGKSSTSTPPDLTPELLYSNADDLYRGGDHSKALEYINKAIELDDRNQAKDPDYFLHPEYYELKGKILQAASNPDGSKAALDRAVELDSDNKYRINLTKEIILERIKVQDLPFFGSFEWNLTPGMNILLGKNGYGKTHLLRLIVALLYCDKIKIRDWIPANAAANTQAKTYVLSDHPVKEDVIGELKSQLKELYEKKTTRMAGSGEVPAIEQRISELSNRLDAELRRIMADKDNITGKIGRVPILAISDSRFITRSANAITNEKIESEDLRKDGATEFLYGRSLEPIINKSLYIIAQNNRTDFTKEPYLLIQRVISELAKQGPMTNLNNADPDKKRVFFQFTRIEPVPATGDFKFFVRSEENQAEVQLQSISQGTLSVLSICLLIYRFLSDLRPQSDEPLKEKAIVLIDEIDAHLHPSWEQKIIGLLRREFPNVQFIITAHSPLIVAGCLENEVNIIRHNGNGFFLEQPTRNFIGSSTPNLFSELFEIEDRDNHYLHYVALSSLETDMRARVENFNAKKEKGGLTPDQEQELEKLYKNLNYIETVNEVQQTEADVATLQTMNETLKQDNARLEKDNEELMKQLKTLKNNQF